ncbi:MAG: wax ester/triacylglycerol synthase family O-acyltransferase [Nocardiaceae bacterium]|nr:wax ester/triacylglycerol synthase family O-acyltransferase [Nocardiaceae bacterium]
MTTTTPLNPIDMAFLWGESDTNLMNIAHLDIFRLPADAAPDFVSNLVAELRAYATATSPFDRRVHGRLLPQWRSVDELDLDYHLQRHRLPAPGGQRELGELVSRLHSIRMDRSHPLWQMHVIEGLDDGRVAIYIKGHHALLDGVATVRLARKVMSTDPEEQGRPAIWAYRETKRRRPDAERRDARLGSGALLEPLRGVNALASSLQAIGRMYGGLRSADTQLVKPYSAPRSILNGPITAERRIATQAFELNRISALAQRTGGTINDVILAICAGALRRYLDELGELPPEPLVAGMPMSFRPKDSDDAEGNATTMALATLATDISDVRERFSAILASTVKAKEHMGGISAAAVTGYTAMLMAPFGAGLMLGTGSRTRPMFNVVISNIPGPHAPLHYNGMTLDEWHAVSIPLDGQALNITIMSYAGRLNLCITACSTALPHVQRLAPYAAEALTELEAAYAQTASAPAVD